MTVILSAELARLVEEKVQSGEFADADEVVSRALELLQHQDDREQPVELLDVCRFSRNGRASAPR